MGVIRNTFPGHQIDVLEVGRSTDGNESFGYMNWINRELGKDLIGVLCLIGARPWAEFYCTWVKERGGVAVDIGSAFDLLAGTPIRSFHQTGLGIDGF